MNNINSRECNEKKIRYAREAILSKAKSTNLSISHLSSLFNMTT